MYNKSLLVFIFGSQRLPDWVIAAAQATELLAQAVAADRSVLEVFITREQFPQQWVETQNNLAWGPEQTVGRRMA